MGIENRDYYRDSNNYTDRLSGWGFGRIPPVCKWIIIVNVVVFLAQIFITRSPSDAEVEAFARQYGEPHAQLLRDRADHERDDADESPSDDLTEGELAYYRSRLGRESIVENWFRLETSKVLRGQVWRLLTCAFCHTRMTPWHILMNMLFLYWFGVTLELMYGEREFLLFYLTAAIVASLAYVGLDLATGGSTPAIGASGAVMGVTMLFAIHYPRHVILVMYIIPLEVRWLVVLYVIFDLHPVLLALAGYPQATGIAHAAHLGGLAFGFVYWKFNLRLAPFTQRLRLPRWDRTFGARRGIRMHEPSRRSPDRKLDSQVDDILRKIHEQGEASLTERERATLTAASKRYQERNRPNL